MGCNSSCWKGVVWMNGSKPTWPGLIPGPKSRPRSAGHGVALYYHSTQKQGPIRVNPPIHPSWYYCYCFSCGPQFDPRQYLKVTRQATFRRKKKEPKKLNLSSSKLRVLPLKTSLPLLFLHFTVILAWFHASSQLEWIVTLRTNCTLRTYHCKSLYLLDYLNLP